MNKIHRFFGISFLTLALQVIIACGDSSGANVRKSILAGTWYEGTQAKLTQQVDGFLKQVPQTAPNPNRVRALVVPHAGYEYSGETAAYAYKVLTGAPIRRVVILGPSHRAAFRGGSIADADAYETPLGLVNLDKEACKSLRSSSLFQSLPEADAQEHSLEIQLPFLQRTLKEFTIVPIVVGDISSSDGYEMAKAIQPLLDEKTLLVMSSDFTHQGPRFGYIPFKDNIRANVQRLDFAAVNPILNLDANGFADFIERTQATICGHNPICIGLAALPQQTQVEFVRYATSGDKTKSYDESVSYSSLVFRERKDYLDEKETALMLEIARKTLEQNFAEGKAKEYQPEPNLVTERLKEKKGVFVTLNKKGELRGCIGDLQGSDPLCQTAAKTVLLSAFRDTRFNQLQKEELKDVDIEISVMSPRQPVDSWKDIVLGRDGFILEKKGRSALFLPQVALEQGWTVEDALKHLCLKAGLQEDDWKSGCSFQTFTAQVFGETFKKQ
ncbi:MAG: AmmeMemoRadiSam system protein B [Candidatus Omnitrophota bacterium]